MDDWEIVDDNRYKSYKSNVDTNHYKFIESSSEDRDNRESESDEEKANKILSSKLELVRNNIEKTYDKSQSSITIYTLLAKYIRNIIIKYKDINWNTNAGIVVLNIDNITCTIPISFVY